MARPAAIPATLFILVSLLATHSLAQQQAACSNYGSLLSNGTCGCPPGFDPATACTLAACDNPLESNFARQPFSAVLAGNASTGCARQCTSGFAGPNCNVCTGNQACASALQALNGGGGGAGSSSNGMSLTNGLGEPVCSTGPWTWTEGFASCDVVNPTLQSVFAGSTTLTIQKTVSPSQSLSSPFGTNGTMTAQLWYASLSGNTTVVEQFFCTADQCAQTNSTTTGNAEGEVDWTCQNLRCTCIPGTTFCGAPGSQLDLTSTIDGLSGVLDITCDAATGTQCAFKQDVLKTLFGANGLALSGCRWGECVLPGTISALADALAGKGTNTGGGGSGLSGGVIAGLAVLGGVIGALLVLLALGKASQRRARKRAREEDEKALLVASNGAATLHSGAAGGASSGSASSSSQQDAGEKLELPPSLPPIGLEWSNLSYSLSPTPHFSFLPFSSSSTRPREGKQILSSLSARVEPGSFVSILGPSGAGKSTLVDLLAGVRKSGKREGKVELVGVGEGEDEVRIGYVDQGDELPETSTVREAVMLAAELKLGEIPHEKKRDRVFEVLTQLGLLDVADSVIGSPEGSGTRGISGGERRRVSIALELVARPAVLIADEPTSGLDSTSALRILTALKALTLPSPSTSSSRPTRRTTVICTIHQPSSQLYHLFDDVLLLAQGGTQLFFGKAAGAREWWEEKGERCPEGWNPADFLLDLATSPPAAFIPLRPSPTTCKSAASLPASPPHATHELPYTSSPTSRPFFPTPRSLLRNTNAHQRASRKPTTTAMTQVEVLAKREARNLVRDRGLVLMHNVVPMIVGLFVGGMFYKVNLTIGGFQSRVGALFFLGCLIAFASLSALSNFAHAKRIFIRERARGYYSPVTWLASKLVFDIVPLRLVPTIVLATIVYWMVGLAHDAAHFFKFLLILILFAICTTLWNFVLAAAIDDTGSAILVSSVLNLFQMAFAGFFINLRSIPPVLRWLQWLAPLKYALEAVTINEVGAGLMIVDELAGAKVQISAEIIMQTLFGFKQNAYYRDVLVLFAFIVGFALILIATVLVRLRELR
ncbi:RHTO0S01e00936g1_1 [Rhodotorula toruloides]|uniref:RHTO0S01e00936g1_1 n=2 Tax=Rhodotorula toruloides TaxID=5286 RepID=A0A061AEF5_RHOTO|nr:ATP-binding cassette, subfamily G (WHITE), member 2 [Rhodotorula toruloides NP11]EMS19828.1 ATP-binding cassette, subfamily G (WHITE), member 2 [Rhodotorula toruloides NP11]CDR35510.1 RHTO0S01e00936g1_1 [Rhodotorula toruloides]